MRVLLTVSVLIVACALINAVFADETNSSNERGSAGRTRGARKRPKNAERRNNRGGGGGGLTAADRRLRKQQQKSSVLHSSLEVEGVEGDEGHTVTVPIPPGTEQQQQLIIDLEDFDGDMDERMHVMLTRSVNKHNYIEHVLRKDHSKKSSAILGGKFCLPSNL